MSMLASISPVGEASRSQRWTVTVGAYLVGSVLGGTALGASAAGLGTAVRRLLGGTGAPSGWAAAVVAVGALVAVALDRRWLPVRVPSWQRQVDERWLTSYRGWVYGAGFGLQLGAGLLTRVPTAAVWLVPWIAAVTASLPAGAAIGAWFGLVRALPVLATRPLTDPAGLQRLHRRLDAAAPRVDRATVAVVGMVAVAALAGAVLTAPLTDTEVEDIAAGDGCASEDHEETTCN
jgi:hypothetical protein